MFERFKSKFILDAPCDANAFDIYADAWKYGFDKRSKEEIWQTIDADPRPRWCAETFGSLSGKTVMELGPADGYNTAELERLGANVISVEGNVDAFLRCLIFKNAFDLKAKFLLGDFTKAFEGDVSLDLLYACGVLYHLQDPVGFLDKTSKVAENLFIWTHYYDPSHVERVEHERIGFAAGRKSKREFKGRTFTYYEKEYHLDHVQSAGYIGGLNATCAYLSRDDLFTAIEVAGYKVLRVVDDPATDAMVGAVNVLATKI